MKVKYIGETFYGGYAGLTDGKIYECLSVEYQFLRIIDDEGYPYWEKLPDEPDGYLYFAVGPCAPDGSSSPGKWEIVEDDEKGTLKRAIIDQIFDEVVS